MKSNKLEGASQGTAGIYEDKCHRPTRPMASFGYVWEPVTMNHDHGDPTKTETLRCSPWEGGVTEQCSYITAITNSAWQLCKGQSIFPDIPSPHKENGISSEVLKMIIPFYSLYPLVTCGWLPTKTGPNACERGTGTPPTPRSTHDPWK